MTHDEGSKVADGREVIALKPDTKGTLDFQSRVVMFDVDRGLLLPVRVAMPMTLMKRCLAAILTQEATIEDQAQDMIARAAAAGDPLARKHLGLPSLSLEK